MFSRYPQGFRDQAAFMPSAAVAATCAAAAAAIATAAVTARARRAAIAASPVTTDAACTVAHAPEAAHASEAADAAHTNADTANAGRSGVACSRAAAVTHPADAADAIAVGCAYADTARAFALAGSSRRSARTAIRSNAGRSRSGAKASRRWIARSRPAKPPETNRPDAPNRAIRRIASRSAIAVSEPANAANAGAIRRAYARIRTGSSRRIADTAKWATRGG